MTDDPLTMLENRVKTLEAKIFGQSDPIPDLPSPIIDDLLESHKVVSSALSGREKIATVVKRLDQLETVLDPMYEDSVIDSAAKLAFVLSTEVELEDITRQLVRINELSPCLESEQLRNIPHLMKQMGKLSSTMSEHKEKYDVMEEKFDDLISKYTEITNGVTAVFATLDNMVTELEIKAKPKKIID
uniref:Dynactin subunit 3 n=1 Tax=Graphocephala atropunctata TaxID=36148 RepID=A0A1B6LF95_9HEMI